MAVSYMVIVCLLVAYLNGIHNVFATEVKITCADNLKFYADGNEIGSHNNKATAKTFTIPDETKVVGVTCTVDKTKSVNAGIIASFKTEYAGDYITDATWRCTKSFTTGWASSSYDDSTWLNAVTSGSNTNGDAAAGLSVVSGIVDHAKWIWTSNYATKYGDPTVYCRGRLSVERRYDNYGRRFLIGFMDNFGTSKGINLLLTTLKSTDVTVYCFTPHIAKGASGYLSEVRTVNSKDDVKQIKPHLNLRNNDNVVNGDKTILCYATDAVKMVGENQEAASSDLFLVIPVDSLGVKCESTNEFEFHSINWDRSDGGSYQRILILAPFANTQVEITPTDTVTYNGKSYSANKKFTISISQFRATQIAGSYDLTGTMISSKCPIVVYSGNKKTAVKGTDANAGSADHLVEQLTPTNTWGNEFALTPLPYGSGYRSKRHLAWYKITAAAKSTSIRIEVYLNGVRNNVITRTLNAGETYKYEHKHSHTAYVTSSNGIQVAQFATTKQSSDCIGDPWLQMIPPLYSFDRDYSILPPLLTERSGCNNAHFFTVIVKKQYKDDIIIDQKKIADFKDIKILGYFEIGGTDYVYQTVQISRTNHRVQHTNPNVNFGLYYFGYGSYDSYASMGGTRTAPINKPCVKTTATLGDGLDNDCNGLIDDVVCTTDDPTKDCAFPSPVNGAWSSWAVNGPCTCNAGTTNGLQPYTRECNNPVPKYNGLPCSGDGTKTVACICVPIDGGWSDWGTWGQCSKSCDTGVSTRSRTCSNPYAANGGKECSGSDTDNKDCLEKYCPINGGWSKWSMSGSCTCTGTSNNGLGTYTRKCDNPAPQYNGLTCSGDAQKSDSCICPPIDGAWSEWGAWGQCSKTCGDGVNTRTRTCSKPAPKYGGKDCAGANSDSSKACFLKHCPIHGGWSSWVTVSTCVCPDTSADGKHNQARNCTNPEPQYDGDYCTGSATQQANCNCQPIHGNWANWEIDGVCECKSGKNGEQKYNRTCTNPAPKHTGNECDLSVQGSTKAESCDCLSDLQDVNQYLQSVDQVMSVPTNTITSTSVGLTDCHKECEADPACVGVQHEVVNGVETCKRFSELGPLSKNKDNTLEVVVLLKNSAIAATTTTERGVGNEAGKQQIAEQEAQQAELLEAEAAAQSNDNTATIAGALGGVAGAGVIGAAAFAAARKFSKKKEKKQGVEANDCEVEDLDSVLQE